MLSLLTAVLGEAVNHKPVDVSSATTVTNRTTALPMQQQQHHSPSVIPQQTLLIFSHDLLLHLKHCTNRAAV